jgi:hypothetical protein
MHYNFPRTKFVDETDLYTELEHLEEEAGEVKDALFECDLDHLAEELWDFNQNAESALRILEEKYGINTLKARLEVIKKNEGRGYYTGRHPHLADPLPSLWQGFCGACKQLWRNWAARLEE